MTILNWFFRPLKFVRYEDSYASCRQFLWPMLLTAIAKQQSDGFSVLLVAHFAQTFTSVQDLLENSGMDYQIVDRSVAANDFMNFSSLELSTVQLSLSHLLEPSEKVSREASVDRPISMIMVERHPLPQHDCRALAFAKGLQGPTRFGYYLAIDDVVVRRAVNDTTVVVLKQLGLKDHDLITSNLISRRLEKVLDREASQYAQDLPADSAQEWYRRNEVRLVR